MLLKKHYMDWLFVTDGFDGVEPGGFAGGIPAEEDTGERAYGERENDGPRLDVDGPAGDEFDGQRSPYAQDDTDQAAGDADDDRFDEELEHDVAAFGPDGHAQADFAGALGDRYVHDVHDADPAY